MIEARKQFSKLGLMYFLGSMVVIAVQLLFIGLCSVVKPEWLTDMSIYMFVAMLPMYLIGIPIWAMLIKRVPGQAIEQHSMKFSQVLIAAMMCYCIMYLSNLVGVFTTFIIGLIKGSAVNNDMLSIATSNSVWTNLIIMVLLAPPIEEYIFRKLLVERTVKYGQATAVVLSGLLFGLFHGNLNQFVYAFTLGMFFAFIYVKTGKLRYSIGLHVFINFMSGVAGTLMLKLVNYEAITDAVSAGVGTEELMALYMENLPGLLAFGIYVILILGFTIAGFVLLIVFRKKFTFEPGEVVIEKGTRFKTIFFNIGMILYGLFWLAMIIRQLLA